MNHLYSVCKYSFQVFPLPAVMQVAQLACLANHPQEGNVMFRVFKGQKAPLEERR